MTTIAISDIPSNIDTLERLHSWSGYALALVNPSIAVLEAPDRAEKVAQAIIFQAADNTYRHLSRVCLPFSEAYMNDRSQKAWMFAQQISNTQLPAAFKTP